MGRYPVDIMPTKKERPCLSYCVNEKARSEDEMEHAMFIPGHSLYQVCWSLISLLLSLLGNCSQSSLEREA